MRGLKRFTSFMMAAMIAVCLFLSSALAENSGEFSFASNADGTGYVVTAYNGQASSVTVPDWHNGLPVVAIGEGAFQGNGELRSVSLPSSVTVIGKAAFKNCSALAAVTSYAAAAQPPAPPRVPGDANDDGMVNIVDALVVLQYDVGWDVPINISNADVNGSGGADIMDALLILQYDVGWDIELQ